MSTIAQPSRELTDLLVELAVASQRRAMYPGGHPSLEASEQRVIDRLAPILAARETLTIGVARDQLIIEGVASDARHPLLRALAARLHGHRIAAIKLTPGLSVGELADLLGRLARDPAGRASEPPSAAMIGGWTHVQLFRQAYERLTLIEDAPTAGDDAPRVLPRAAQLWLALAQAALNASGGAGMENTDPAVMAKAMNERTGGADEEAYEQVVVGYLLQIAQELKTSEGHETNTLRDRVSHLVENLSPQAMERLLAMGGDLAQRRTFLLDASAGMAVDAVMSITVAAANVSRQAISQPLMRLLVKLAGHAQRGAPPLRATTDAAFRDQVKELIEGWTLPDPTSDTYSRALDTMARPADLGPIASGITQVIEPERMLEICLELRSTTPALWDAVTALCARGDIVAVLDTLDTTPADNPLPGVIRTRIATPEHFRQLLAAPSVDAGRIGDFARRVGEPATDLLLDALIESTSRGARRRILDVLGSLGDTIGPAVVRRLPSSPWYAQRNLLILMSALEQWPAEFMATDYASNADVRVRREALRLLLKRPSTRTAGIVTALGDTDPQVIRMGLEAASTDCPPAAVPRLASRLAAHSLAPPLDTLAIRAIGTTTVPAALTCLLGLSSKRTRWLRRHILTHKSAPMLAALTALAHRWADEPRVARLIALAARSSDSQVRAAVTIAPPPI